MIIFLFNIFHITLQFIQSFTSENNPSDISLEYKCFNLNFFLIFLYLLQGSPFKEDRCCLQVPEKLLLLTLPIAGTWLLYVFFITNTSHTLCFIHSRPICIESPGVTRLLRDLGTTLGSITARHIYKSRGRFSRI